MKTKSGIEIALKIIITITFKSHNVKIKPNYEINMGMEYDALNPTTLR